MSHDSTHAGLQKHSIGPLYPFIVVGTGDGKWYWINHVTKEASGRCSSPRTAEIAAKAVKDQRRGLDKDVREWRRALYRVETGLRGWVEPPVNLTATEAAMLSAAEFITRADTGRVTGRFTSTAPSLQQIPREVKTVGWVVPDNSSPSVVYRCRVDTDPDEPEKIIWLQANEVSLAMRTGHPRLASIRKYQAQ